MNLTKTSCLFLAMVASVCLYGDNAYWLGTADSTWSNARNWDPAKVPVAGDYIVIHSEGNHPADIADGDEISCSRIYLTYSAGLIGVVNQTGGILRFTNNNVADFTLGYSSFQPADKEGWNTYNLSGGAIIDEGANGGMIIGRWARGRLVQTGGSITLGGNIYMAEQKVTQKGATHEGEYLMSGGTLTQTGATSVMRMGIQDDSKWVLSGDAVATLGSTLELGFGDGVTLGGNAKLMVAKIMASGDGAAQAKFAFDGGTLALKDGVADASSFINGLASLTVLSGGAKIEIPAGATATIRQPLTAATGSTGGLVKKGAGTLVLAAGNTYAGATVVEAGVLGLNEPIDVETLSIAEGANVMINPSQWSANALEALTEKVKAAGNDNYLTMGMDILLADGEVRTISDDIDLGAHDFILRGNGTLKLTGNNSWTGKTIVYGGTLAAKRGAGLPATSELVLAGGSWAPADGTAPVTAKEEAGVLSVAAEAPLAVAAVGGNETVRLAEEGTAWMNPNGHKAVSFNENGDATLTVSSDMTLGAEVAFTFGSTEEKAKTSYTGTLSSPNAWQKFTGTGRLDLEKGATLQAKGMELSMSHLVVKDGATVSPIGGAALPYSPAGTTIDIEKGGVFHGDNDIRIADGNGAKSVVNVKGELSTTSYFHAGRRGTATGTLNVEEGGVVSAGTLIVGEGQSTATLNQRGGTVTANSFQMGNTRNESNGAGSATYNLEAGTLSVTANDPYFGYYGTTYFNLKGGEVTLPNKYAYVGVYGKTYFNQTGGKITFPNRAHLNYHPAAAPDQSKTYAEYNLTGGTLLANSDWRVGNHGKGVFNMSGGSTEIGGYLHIGAESDATKGIGDGEVTFTGGDAVMKNRTQLGSTASAKGVLTVDTHDNGSVEFRGDVAVAAAGNGTFNLKSGTVRQTGGYFYVGRDVTSWGGVANISGGVYDFQTVNGVVSIGTQSDGVLNMTGGLLKMSDSGRIELGYFRPDPGFKGQGTINLSGDAVIEATRIHAGNGAPHGIINANGGTIRAVQNSADFMTNVELNLGEKGVTLDSNGFDVNASGAVLGKSAGTVRKIGAGAVSLHDFPLAKTGVKVEAGKLQVVPQSLRHRWTFNGTFDDTISGAKSALNKNVKLTADGKALDMKSDTQIDLGRNALPVDHDATIEMWLTRTDKGTWEKLLALGANKNDILFIGPQDNGTDVVVVGYTDTNTAGGSFSSGNTRGLGTMPMNKPVHLSVTITRTSETTMDLVYRMKGMDGKTIGTVTIKPTGTLGTLAQDSFWLGQNPWSNVSTVCSIDEVRVWDVALTDEQLTENVALGPDTLPQLTTTQSIADEAVKLPENPSEELVANNYLAHRWKFDGDLKDEITGADPQDWKGTSFTEDGKALRLTGDAKWLSYVNLGPNLLAKDDSPVTIEIWATDREYREWAKMFSFGNSKNDLFSINTNSGAADKPGYLTFTSNDFGTTYGTENFPAFKETHYGERLYYAIVIVPDGNGAAEVTLTLKDAETGAPIEQHVRIIHWTPALSKQGAFYLGVSYWSNVGPAMDFEEVRFWNAALSDAQMTANVLRGPDVLPTTFDSIPLKVEVAKDATLDLGFRPVTLHDLDAAGSLGSANVTVDGVLTPGGDGTVGTLAVDGSLTVTGTLRLDLGDTIELTGDLTLDGATIEFSAPMEEVDAYVRQHSWVIATTSSGTISARDLLEARHSFRWRNTGKVLKAISPGFMVLVR